MPIINLTKGIYLDQRVTVADNFLARLVGLLGTGQPDPHQAFYIVPCMAVHTFGMKYPLDVVFLDRQGKVIGLFQNLLPNKMTKIILAAKGVLELPSGAIKADTVQIGDYLEVNADEHDSGDRQALRRIFHWPANFFLALLWARLVLSSFLSWQQKGEVLSLGLVLVNTVLFFLFLTRRESSHISHRILDWIIPMLTVGLSMTLKPYASANHSFNVFSVGLQFAGILAMLFSLVSLGRSFGIVPAHRQIKHRGPYQLVRHPLYASEMLFYLGFLVGNFSAFNLAAVILIFAGQIWRALAEEKLLSQNQQYRAYRRKVLYRLLPGVF